MSELPLTLSQHYHERTKYDPATLSQRGRALNFAEQPSPYKIYPVGSHYDLKPYLKADVEPQSPLARLSRLLYFSYGITAAIPAPNETFYLRAAPSAGGLYPAEIYLIAREDAILPPGLYNYQALTHTLCHYWSDQVWPAFESACLWHPALRATPLALVVTAVFQRSAWRYEDRAYRRIFLDGGHLLGNLELAATLNHYRVHLLGGFIDVALNQLLYLDDREEGAIAAIALADLLEINQNLPHYPPALPSPTQIDFPEIPDGALLLQCYQSSQIEDQTLIYRQQLDPLPKTDAYNFAFCDKIPTQVEPITWQDPSLEETIHRRRSTRRYTGEAIDLEALLKLLDFTYHPEQSIEQGFDGNPDFFDLSLIETFIAVSAVNGLEAGCYYYAVQAQELRQIRFKQFRAELYRLCLHQELGRDAAAVIFHTANLQAATERYGDRTYRYLHLDAGHLGQRLNLAAIQMGLGVSGIAGFFDDQVNEVLGIPAAEAVLYLTTIGQPPRQS